MRTFDTNVVVRLIVEDDEEQGQRAEAAWRSALADGGVFLPKLILAETVWVLRRAYRFDRETVLKAILDLIDIDGVTIEDEGEVRSALTHFERGRADFSDYLILESARELNALPVITFDESFSQDEDVEAVADLASDSK